MVDAIGICHAFAGEVTQDWCTVGVAVARRDIIAQLIAGEASLHLVGETLRNTRNEERHITASHKIITAVQICTPHQASWYLPVVSIVCVYQSSPVADKSIFLISGLIDNRQPLWDDTSEVVDAARAEHAFRLAPICIRARIGITIKIPHHGVALSIANHHED